MDEDDILYKDPELDLIETENFIQLNGEKLYRPFIEKPINGEDHEIRIYYKRETYGGGYAVLFRKT